MNCAIAEQVSFSCVIDGVPTPCELRVDCNPALMKLWLWHRDIPARLWVASITPDLAALMRGEDAPPLPLLDFCREITAYGHLVSGTGTYRATLRPLPAGARLLFLSPDSVRNDVVVCRVDFCVADSQASCDHVASLLAEERAAALETAAELQNIRENLAQADSVMNTKLTEAHNAAAAAASAAAAAHAQALGEWQDRFAALEAAHRDLGQTAAELRARAENAEAAVAKAAADGRVAADDAARLAAALEHEHNTASQDAAAAAAAARGAADEISRLQRDLAVANALLVAERDAVTRARAEAESARAAAAAATAELAGVREEVRASHNSGQNAHTALAAAETRAEAAAAALASLEQRTARDRAAAELADRRVAAATEERERACRERDETARQLAAANSRVTEQARAVADLRGALEAARNEIKGLQTSLDRAAERERRPWHEAALATPPGCRDIYAHSSASPVRPSPPAATALPMGLSARRPGVLDDPELRRILDRAPTVASASAPSISPSQPVADPLEFLNLAN